MPLRISTTQYHFTKHQVLITYFVCFMDQNNLVTAHHDNGVGDGDADATSHPVTGSSNTEKFEFRGHKRKRDFLQ